MRTWNFKSLATAGTLLIFLIPDFTSAEELCSSLPETLQSGDQLNSFINECGIADVNHLLEKLPRSYRENFTLMYKSRAENEVKEPGTVTPATPRAILFGGKGNLILTFSSNAAKSSYEELQMLEYDEKENKTLFKTIRFSNGKPIYNRNPVSCKGCHGENQNPIWQQYSKWPGAYGSEDDRLSSLERKDFQDFIRNVGATEKSRFSNLDKEILEQQFDSYYENRNLTITGPNFKLTTVLSNMVAKKAARRLEKSPEFVSYRNMLIWSAYSCHNGILTSKGGDNIDLTIKQAMAMNPKMTRDSALELLLGSTNNMDPVEHAMYEIDPIAYQDLHSLPSSYPYNYRTGIGYLSTTAINLLAQDAGFRPIDTVNYFRLNNETFKHTSQLLKTYASINPMTGDNLDGKKSVCAQLSRTLKDGTWFENRGTTIKNEVSMTRASGDAAKAAHNPLSKCISCHTGDSPIGNPIPFDNVAKLKLYFSTDTSAKSRIISAIETGRMPLYQNKLSDSEQMDIRNFLDHLTQ